MFTVAFVCACGCTCACVSAHDNNKWKTRKCLLLENKLNKLINSYSEILYWNN